MYKKIEDTTPSFTVKKSLTSYGSAGSPLMENIDDAATVSKFLQSSSAFAKMVKLNDKTGDFDIKISQIENFNSLCALAVYLQPYQPRGTIGAISASAKQMLPGFLKAAPTIETLLTELANEVSTEIKRLGFEKRANGPEYRP